jgi:L-ascorbate metabolism protein UlaG (beta-lactamase superfamily)
LEVREMQAIAVTNHHHACVFVQGDETRILVDPGQLGSQAALDGVDGVLITHSHFDHFDPDLIHAALDQGIDV